MNVENQQQQYQSDALTNAVAPSATINADENEENKKIRLLKIALPHVCLYVLLILYLLAGAWAFSRIEYGAERQQQMKKLERISDVYEKIATEMGEDCGLWATSNTEQQLLFRERLFASLSRVSQHFEGSQFRLGGGQLPLEIDSEESLKLLDEVLPPRWNAMSSILYALSILTTTGYGPATPMTPLGQCLSILYGLLGIPLTVLAAVDIGRFLSDVVLAVYDRILRATNRLATLCGARGLAAEQVISQVVDAGSLKSFKLGKPVISFGKAKKEQNDTVSSGPKKQKEPMKAEDKDQGVKRRLPLSVNAAVLLLFCTLGGLVYQMAAGNAGRNFIEGFFVTFNLVANLTMSEVPTDISHLMTLVYIFLFVTFGLAVLSMCADLAASELKWIFLKIHYFGRKINWAKRKAARKNQQQMEFEVNELLKLIDQIRARYPDRQNISSLDILKYVQELNGGATDGPYGSLPYRSFNMWLLQHHRRNTLAFMPQSFDALKFADEMDQEEEQMLKSTVNALLINWRRQRRSGEQNTFIPLLPFGV